MTNKTRRLVYVFAHDVPTRSHLHFCLNCQTNEEIIKNRCSSLKNSLYTHPNYLLSYMKSCLITTLMRFATRKTTRKKSKQQNMQRQTFDVKNFHLNSKAHGNNVKRQPGKTFTTQIYFFLTKKHIGFLLLRLGNKSTHRGNNERNSKISQLF